MAAGRGGQIVFTGAARETVVVQCLLVGVRISIKVDDPR
jgi:hypothetical protein